MKKLTQEDVDKIIQEIKKSGINVTLTDKEFNDLNDYFELSKIVDKITSNKYGLVNGDLVLMNEEETLSYNFNIKVLNTKPVRMIEINDEHFKNAGRFIKLGTKYGNTVESIESEIMLSNLNVDHLIYDETHFILINQNILNESKESDDISSDDNYHLQDMYSYLYSFSYYNLVVIHELLHSITNLNDSENFNRKVIVFILWLQNKKLI